MVLASWLVHSTPERAVWVQALARDIVLRSWARYFTLTVSLVRALAKDIVSCSWVRHFTLAVPLSTQVYKWVPGNLMLWGNPAMD